MAYEIPQQLQHKEKILFGLTFGQLGWSALFGFIILIIILSGSGTSRFFFAIFPLIFGILFVFFDLSVWLSHLLRFVRFRHAFLGDQKLKDLVEITKIEDDSLKARGEVAILRVFPLNFSIKNDDEKDGIIVGFQRFLNSLDFPVQFVVSTRNLNLDSYLKNMKSKVTNKELFADFEDFLNTNISEKEMRNREFFVVIRKVSNLDIQTRICQDRLSSIGLRNYRLNNVELQQHMYLFFNDVDDKRVSDGERTHDGTHFLIAPNRVKDVIDSLEVNDRFCKIVSATGFPRIVDPGFLDKIISSNDDFDISIHVEPFPISTMMVMLNKELQKQRADLYSEEKKSSINPSLEIKYADTRKVLEELQKGNEKLFNVSLYINCKAKNKKDLDLLTKKVEAELNSLMMVPNKHYFQQVSAYKSMIPIAMNNLGMKRNITTKALSAFFPFTSPFLTVDPDGVMLGLNRNKVPYIRDIFSLSNANGIILATSGSGKSYFTKLLISRQMLNNTQVIAIDPQSEYLGLAQAVNGEVITISRNSETIINPFDLMGHDYIEKRLMLMDLFKVMFGDLSDIQRAILDRAVGETYARKGITDKKHLGIEPPILSDLYDVLVSMERNASQMEKVTYRALINRLYMYTEGVFSFLNRQTSINFDNQFVVFNIGDMPKQVQPTIMFLILDYVYMRMKKDKQKKLLVIDEAWSLLGKSEEASYIFEIVKTCRKFNLGLLLITQDVADLVNSKAGGAVLANSAYTFLLRQKPAVIDNVVKKFHLSDMEKEYLLTATQGKGILILDNEHQELEVVASPKEHALITTNPNEIIIQQTKTKPSSEQKTKINIDLDNSKKMFWGKNLSEFDKNYLANNNFVAGNFVPLGQKHQEEFWIKTNKVESPVHTFLVENLREYVGKFTKKVEVYITAKPDIVFKDKQGREIAIEVETGKHFKKHKNRLITKFTEAKNKYKDIVILLTDTNYTRHYQNLQLNIPIYTRASIDKFIQSKFKTKSK